MLLFNGAVIDNYAASDNGTQQITLNYTDINNNKPDKGLFKLRLQHEQYGCVHESEEEERDCKYINILSMLILLGITTKIYLSISSYSYQYYRFEYPT